MFDAFIDVEGAECSWSHGHGAQKALLHEGRFAEGSVHWGTSALGSMSEPPPIDSRIKLGENHELSREDLTRALVCSTAVYFGRAEADKYLQKTLSEYPSITFQEVSLSEDNLMLVAYTEQKKEVFIAFRGTKKDSLEDVGCDLRIDEKFQHGGSFHSGFSERADELMGSKHNIISLLLSQPDKPRIIFCGHSLGGGVAYMALLHFLLDTHILEGKCNYHDSLFAVAFGAPHVCDERAAKAINKNIDLRWRFINFVNQQDPVPRLLHHLKNSLVKGLRARLASNSGSILKAIGGFIGESTQVYAEGGGGKVFAITAKKAAEGFFKSARQTAINALGNFSEKIIPDSKNPDFYPIGQYVFLLRGFQGSEGVPVWDFVVRDGWGRDDQFLELLARVEITQETLAFHLIRPYMSVLIGANFLDRPADCSKSEVPAGADHVLVTIPKPKVTLAEWRNIESTREHGRKYIFIKGENLLFLRGVVVYISGDGENDWVITQQSDTALRLFEPESRTERLEMVINPGGKNAVPVVIITTAFGSAHCPILDKNSVNQTASGGAIIRMLGKIVQTLVVKASLPRGYVPSREVLDRLDNIMQCVPQADRRKMSEHVGAYTNCILDGDMNPEVSTGKIDNMNNMVKAVEVFLSSSLEVTYGQSDAQVHLRSAAFLSTFGIAAAAVASAPVLAGAACLVFVTCVGGVVMLGKNSVIIEGYTDVLDLAIKEAIQWSGHGDTRSGILVKAYEDELITQVKDAGVRFNIVVNELDGKHLKSELFQRATEDSKKQFLKRIKVVRDIESLSTSMDRQEHFIGIFGAEDTGKTTFIKKVLEYHSLSAEAPTLKTGPDVHTASPAAYSLPGSRWIVDFPGSNGVGIYADTWEKMSALSSSAILLLDFEFDMKREQTDLYWKMKNMLQTEVSVVFNKVDQYFYEIFDDNEPSQEDYLRNVGKSHAAKLNCNENKVHFACLEPDPEADINKLKAIGVVDFEGLARRLGVIAC